MSECLQYKFNVTNRSSDQTCARGMIHNKNPSHSLRLSPAQYSLTVHNPGLKHQSFIHTQLNVCVNNCHFFAAYEIVVYQGHLRNSLLCVRCLWFGNIQSTIYQAAHVSSPSEVCLGNFSVQGLTVKKNVNAMIFRSYWMNTSTAWRPQIAYIFRCVYILCCFLA